MKPCWSVIVVMIYYYLRFHCHWPTRLCQHWCHSFWFAFRIGTKRKKEHPTKTIVLFTQSTVQQILDHTDLKLHSVENENENSIWRNIFMVSACATYAAFIQNLSKHNAKKSVQKRACIDPVNAFHEINKSQFVHIYICVEWNTSAIHRATYTKIAHYSNQK